MLIDACNSFCFSGTSPVFSFFSSLYVRRKTAASFLAARLSWFGADARATMGVGRWVSDAPIYEVRVETTTSENGYK